MNVSRTYADLAFKDFLEDIYQLGDLVETRNHLTRSSFSLPLVTFNETPFITYRRIAWKKALKEMEWFLSGESKCPEELLDWWEGQLNPDGRLVQGYGEQFRHSSMEDRDSIYVEAFDQVKFLQEALKNNPNSRRLILTSWNPGEMANITTINENPNTPTTCHNTCTQFFVRNGKLSMKTYQRSADMLLGVPHNWIQSWAMLMWFAHHAGLEVGAMVWSFGDAHIYQEESHIEVTRAIIESSTIDYTNKIELVYNPTSEEFLASDFNIKEEIPEPISKVRPKLL